MGYIKKVDQDLLKNLEKFHGALAPGLLIGAYMVELAYEKLGDAELIDAVVESRKCIPDAVQLMTSCTFGNGWLKVYDWGIFAITLYDKRSKKGVRVYLDVNKLPEDSLIRRWFFMEGPKEPHEKVTSEILRLKTSIFSYEPVEVEIPRKVHCEIKICEQCGYPFPSLGQERCKSCSEDISYYRRIPCDL